MRNTSNLTLQFPATSFSGLYLPSFQPDHLLETIARYDKTVVSMIYLEFTNTTLREIFFFFFPPLPKTEIVNMLHLTCVGKFMNRKLAWG